LGLSIPYLVGWACEDLCLLGSGHWASGQGGRDSDNLLKARLTTVDTSALDKKKAQVCYCLLFFVEAAQFAQSSNVYQGVGIRSIYTVST
jgi:hypothetical protein